MDYSTSIVSEWVRLGMRKAFGKQMEKVASENTNVLVLTADVANSANLEGLRSNYPNQFYNLGISEANMTGVAAGLAKEGSNVFITTFAPFVTMRNYEAIRTLLGYMHLNVKIVGLASGLSLGVQGNTHFSLEDISLMSVIPGMMVLSPADVIEEARCLDYLSHYNGPAYIRLTGIDGSPCIYQSDSENDITKLNLLRDGDDVAIIATGSILTECIRAARALKRDGVACAVYDCCCIKPLDISRIREIVDEYRIVFVVEEHHCIGGLGSIINSSVSATMHSSKIIQLAIDDYFPTTGNYPYLLKENGLDASSLRDRIAAEIKEHGGL